MCKGTRARSCPFAGTYNIATGSPELAAAAPIAAPAITGPVGWEPAERLRHFVTAFGQKGGRSPEARSRLEWVNLQVQEPDPLCSDLKTITDRGAGLNEYFKGRGPWEKQPGDWACVDAKERPFLEPVEDPEDEHEEEANEGNTSGQTDGNEAKPAWHFNQWYNRLHREMAWKRSFFP